jgi:CCR4-NOT transcription complex subunit 2
MQRPGPPPQRPSAMNTLNFNRTTSGSTPSAAYSYLPRQSPSATAGSSNPFSKGFAFGNTPLPPHLAGFPVAPGSASAPGAGQQGGQSSLSINDFPALGGTGNLILPASGNGSMNYANSTSGLPRPGGDGLNNDDFPSLHEGFNGNGTSASSNQEQLSAAATLQHQRIAREQNQSQTLNAARGGFGEPERNYATKVGMQQPPGMSIAPNWSNAGGAGLGGFENGVTGLSLNGSSGAESAFLSNNSNGGMEGTSMMHNSAPAKTPAQQVLTSPADRFGLLGLLNIIKLQDPDLSMLAMGSDLQALGMRLDASE